MANKPLEPGPLGVTGAGGIGGLRRFTGIDGRGTGRFSEATAGDSETATRRRGGTALSHDTNCKESSGDANCPKYASGA